LWPDPAQEGVRVSPLGDSLELRRRLALLLANLGDQGIVERIAGSLFTSSVQEDRLQGLLALSNIKQGWTPASRRAYFQVLQDAARFVGGEGLPAFLNRLRADAVATLGEDERLQFAELLAAPKQVDEPLPPSRPRVQAWSLDDVPMLAVEAGGRGNGERGAKVFRDALCSRCHRAGLSGPAVGPDLTFAARRFSRSDMLESIIAPSRSVAENYRNVMVVTESGKVHVGRLLNEGDFRSEKLKLSTDSLRPGQIIELDKKDIVEQRSHETSPMPQGLLDTFTRDEIADLLTFLEEGVGSSK
jgi:putative heme-binding domain-containing protein